jgi:hypothetical protein
VPEDAIGARRALLRVRLKDLLTPGVFQEEKHGTLAEGGEFESR